jgi:signal transduction histidine kinase
MFESGSALDFDKILKQLQDSTEAVSWRDRRLLVKHIGAALCERVCFKTAIELVYLLVADPKWEVRTDIANLMLLLPEKEFIRVAAILTEDTNAFVRKAAERAIDRRNRGLQNIRRSRNELRHVQAQYAVFEKMHGNLAAEKSRAIAETLFDHLAGATVHEMRGILTPLKATASALLHHLDEGCLEPVECRRQLRKFADKLAFMERLLEDMRSYSQPVPMERRNERLSDLVSEALSMAYDHLRGNSRNPENVNVRIDVTENLTIETSRHQILIAITNILKNAFDSFAEDFHTFRDGAIHIQAKLRDTETIEIHVQDNGMGISPDDLQELREFIPFKTSKKNQGTGFGLAIAHRIIRAHGGNVGIESGEDSGTTVTIVLPMEQNDGEGE